MSLYYWFAKHCLVQILNKGVFEQTLLVQANELLCIQRQDSFPVRNDGVTYSDIDEI